MLYHLEYGEFVKVSEINKRMIRNVFLNTEILINEGEKEIFEYDIQAFMFLFLKRFLKGTNLTVGREKAGKVDCVVFEKSSDGGDDTPIVYYEIKTYFKSHEAVKQNDFNKDIEKLAELVSKNSKSSGYFFTAGLTAKFKNEGEVKALPFIASHLNNEKTWAEWKLPNDKIVKLKPGRKEYRGTCTIMMWKIVI